MPTDTNSTTGRKPYSDNGTQSLDRATLLKGLVTALDWSQGRTPFEGAALDTVIRSWEMVIGDIPTHHLQECFIRAARAKMDDYPLTANAVNRAYQEMKPELIRQAQINSAEQDRLLRAGYGSLDRMGIEEWKTRHNLPEAWKLGDPFPPESDLYNKPLPVKWEVFNCAKCQDSGWTRIPFDAKTGRHAQLIKCVCNQSGTL